MLQASTAVHVLMMVLVHPAPVSGPSVNVGVSVEEQLSVTVGAVTAALICAVVGLHGIAPTAPGVIIGGLTSTIQLFVCMNSAVWFPQASIYFQVRVCVFWQLAPSVTTPSLGYPETRETVLHASVTVGSTNAGTTLQILPVIVLCPDIEGGVLSTVHVTVLDVVALLPHASVAAKVRVCDLVHPLLLVVIAPSLVVSVTVPQASVAVAVPSAALISAELGLQGAGVWVTVIVGGVTSLVKVIVWVAVAVLPQASVDLHVLTIVLTHPGAPCSAPSVNVGVEGVEQLSVAVAAPIAALIWACIGLQGIVPIVPSVIVGATLSVTVMT